MRFCWAVAGLAAFAEGLVLMVVVGAALSAQRLQVAQAVIVGIVDVIDLER